MATWILCQLTSSPHSDARVVKLANSDFEKGSLRVVSYARPFWTLIAGPDG